MEKLILYLGLNWWQNPIDLFLAHTHLPTKIHKNPFTTFKNRQTNKPTKMKTLPPSSAEVISDVNNSNYGCYHI